MAWQSAQLDLWYFEKDRRSLADSLRGRTLGVYYALGFFAFLVLVLVYEWGFDTVPWSFMTKILASAVFVLGAVPLLVYLGRGTFKSIPFFEAHCLFYSLSFGFAGFRPILVTGRLADLTESDLVQGLMAALLGLVCLGIGFYILGGLVWRNVKPYKSGMADHPSGSPILVAILFAGAFVTNSMVILGMGWLYQVQQAFGILFLLFFGVSVYGGYLPKWMNICFWLIGLPWMILFGSGLVNNGQIGPLIQVAIWQELGVLWARKRFSLTWVVLMLVAIYMLQPIKGLYRDVVWGGYSLDNTQKIDILFKLIEERFNAVEEDKERKDNFEIAFARANHLVVTAGVIRDTPSVEPYLKGETYTPLLVKWIPRAIWPNKPVEDLGNRWARSYGYLHDNDFSTSFNLPWLPEMYMNFGWLGVAGVSLLVGFVFRYLYNLLAVGPMSAFDYSLAVSLLTGLMIVESHLSMTFGGLVVRAITFIGVVYLLRWVYLAMKFSPPKANA